MNKRFSLILKSLRKNNDYTQKNLATILGLRQTTIANYENGTRIPDIAKIAEMADLFDVSIDYLLGRDTEMTEKNKISSEKKVYDTDISYDDFMIHLMNGNKEKATEVSLSLFEKEVNISKFYQNIIEKSLIETGIQWEKGIVDVWEEHLISEISLDIMRTLNSRFNGSISNGKKMIALNPGSEMHNIGLRMVCDIFEKKGWESIFLGSNLPTKSVMDAIHKKKPHVVALSITMPQHIESACLLINAIRQIYKKNSPSILIGGLGLKGIDNILRFTGADYYSANLENLMSQIDEIGS